MQGKFKWNLCALTLLCIALPANSQNECYLCAEANAVIAEYGLRESETPMRERKGWAPPAKVVTTFPPGRGPDLERILPGVEVIRAGSPEAAAEHIADADVYFGLCTPEIARLGVNLKWIQVMRAGVDTCTDQPELIEREIAVTNLQRLLAKPIAEHAIALTLSLSRKIYVYRDEQLAGQFAGDIRNGRRTFGEGLREINNTTMLVVGLGGIGTEVARLAHALDMRVIATRNSRREGPDFVEYVGLSHELNDLASQADVVVSTLPITDGTRHIHNAEFFAAMKPEAFFVNVGRGETVDSDALAAALHSGAIAAAGIDVAWPEPLPEDHALWSAPNLVMTPHIAGGTQGRMRNRVGPILFENMRRYAAGDALLNEVDIERGY